MKFDDISDDICKYVKSRSSTACVSEAREQCMCNYVSLLSSIFCFLFNSSCASLWCLSTPYASWDFTANGDRLLNSLWRSGTPQKPQSHMGACKGHWHAYPMLPPNTIPYARWLPVWVARPVSYSWIGCGHPSPSEDIPLTNLNSPDHAH